MYTNIYSRYPLKGREIRVLTIRPDSWSAPITCDLSTISLDAKPQFAALSYVWGAQTPACSIQINGHDFTAGRSLETALRYYRQAGWHMPIWADAVCINQSDIAERSSQVNMMDLIYSSADGVFVFLGSGFDLTVDDEFLTMKSLRDFQFRVHGKSWTPHLVAPTWEENQGSDTVPNKPMSILFNFLEGAANLKIHDHLDKVYLWGAGSVPILESEYPWDDLIKIFEAFTSAVWWSRSWTVQESVVGAEPTIVYGTAAAPWSLIREAAQTMDIHVAECCNKYLTNDAPRRFASALRRLISQVDSIERARRAFPKDDSGVSRALGLKDQFSSSFSVEINNTLPMRLLHEYLWLYHDRKATDPCDKVYSLLSLAKMKEYPLDMYPDYAIKKDNVCIKTAREMAQCTCSLDILRAASVFKNPNLPSWVPDWSMDHDNNNLWTQTKFLGAYDASFGTKAEVKVDDTNKPLLKTPGVVIGRVKAVGKSASAQDDFWQMVFQWMQVVVAHAPSTKWVDFCRTVAGDMIIWPKDRVFRRMKHVTKEKAENNWRRHPRTGNYELCVPPQQLTKVSLEDAELYFELWWTLLSSRATEGMASLAASPRMEDQLKALTAQRSLLILDSGGLGLGADSAKDGDLVAIFKGCRFPCIIRPHGNQESHYELVGDAYVHNMMDGQIRNRPEEEADGSGITEETVAGNVQWEMVTLC